MVMQNCWEYFAIFLAAALQGGAISGASVLFTDCKPYSFFQKIFLVELERQFRDSNCKVVFCADKSIDRVLKAAKQCRNIKVHLYNIRKNDIRLGYCRNPYSKIYQNGLSIWYLCI